MIHLSRHLGNGADFQAMVCKISNPFNYLTSKSDWQSRKREMITNSRSSLLVNEFSFSVLRKCIENSMENMSSDVRV